MILDDTTQNQDFRKLHKLVHAFFFKRVKKGTNTSSFISKCYLKRVFSFCRRKYSNAQLLGLSVDDEMLL